MKPSIIVPATRYEVIVNERTHYFNRLFERWLLLGWSLPNMKHNVAQQMAAAGTHR